MRIVGYHHVPLKGTQPSTTTKMLCVDRHHAPSSSPTCFLVRIKGVLPLLSETLSLVYLSCSDWSTCQPILEGRIDTRAYPTSALKCSLGNALCVWEFYG